MRAYGDANRATATRLRRRARPGRGVVPPGDGLERRRGARHRRLVRGAAADGEGARHRAARRAPSRRRRLPAPHGGRPRRARSLDPPPLAVRGEVRDRASSSTTSSVVLGGSARRFRPRTTACRRTRSSTRRSEPRDRRRRARAPPHPRRDAALRARDRRSRAPGGGRARRARAIDFEKGCYPGQEPIARQHYRGRVNRTLRVLEIDGEELPEYDAELRSTARSSAASRAPRRRTATSRARLRPRRGSRATRSSTSEDAECARHDSNTRPLPPQGRSMLWPLAPDLSRSL